MKKILSVILVLSFVFAFASCSGKGNTEPESKAPEKEISIDLNAVKNTIIEKAELNDPLEIGKEQLCELRDIDINDVDDATGVNTLDGTFPDEVILIKAKDADAKKRIIDILNTHLEDIKVQSQNYDAENYALAQECRVIESNNYIALFISAKHAQMEAIFEEAAK